ncbi:MAG: response regulator, partial [Magnetococcus sp. XQGC-1]
METELSKRKILIVDDESANLKLLREILRQEYALVFARSGNEMLQYVGEKPDLILLDVMMPGMDGYEACARLKMDAATQDIPVIFVTARGEVEDEVRGFSVGAVDYLTKPVQAAIVRARVATHLALRSAREVIECQNREIKKQNKALQEAAQLRDDV